MLSHIIGLGDAAINISVDHNVERQTKTWTIVFMRKRLRESNRRYDVRGGSLFKVLLVELPHLVYDHVFDTSQ